LLLGREFFEVGSYVTNFTEGVLEDYNDYFYGFFFMAPYLFFIAFFNFDEPY